MKQRPDDGGGPMSRGFIWKVASNINTNIAYARPV